MTLILVRHAHAGDRSAWAGDDRGRPLSTRGEAQAVGIADQLRDRQPTRLLSSPALRCVQTLEPLGARLGLDVDVVDDLFEGAQRGALADLVHDLRDVDVVMCSHGDVIPTILRLLLDSGMTTPDPLRWQKASTWVITRQHDGETTAAYLPPPDKVS